MNKERRNTYFRLFMFTFIAVLFCSGLSPIIKQTYSDAGYYSYFGKLMAKGGIPYINTLEGPNKGLYVYFLSYVGALLSCKGTFGNYLVEALFKSIDICLIYSISFMHFRENKKSLLATMIMMIIMFSRFTYVLGNQIEQFQFTGYLVVALLVIKYYKKENEKHLPYYMFAFGLCFSYIFNMKFNYCLPFVVLPLVMFVGKKINLVIKSSIFGVVGVFVGFLPALIYILKNNLAKTWYYAIFVMPSALYANSISFAQIFKFFFQIKTVWLVPALFFSTYVVVKKNDSNNKVKAIYILMLLMSCVACILPGQTFAIYHYHLYIYLLPLVIFVSSKINFEVSDLLTFLVSFILILICNMNFIFVKVLPESLVEWSRSYKPMQELSNISKLITDKDRDDKNIKILVPTPLYGACLDVVTTHIEYKYNVSNNYIEDNIEESVVSLENDYIFDVGYYENREKVKEVLNNDYLLISSPNEYNFKLYKRR